MTAEKIVEAVMEAGGQMWADGGKLKYRIPAERCDLISAMRESKSELLDLLSERPAMPPGVRLVRWEPKQPPIRISKSETVTGIDAFIGSTLRQVVARQRGKHWLSGNWTLSTLIERLAAVGCHVALDHPGAALQ